MGDASSIRAGGAVVEIGANDISLKGKLDKAAKQLTKFASFAATMSNKAASNIAIIGARARSMGGVLKTAFGMASKAVSIFIAPLKMLGSGVMWVGKQALSLASSLASIAWTQFKRGVLIATAALAASLKVFADFQQQMAVVNTMLSGGAGSSGAVLEEFTDELKNMSIEFGESTASLSKGLYDILSASIPTEKALEVLAVSARAAKAGISDTGTAADVITTILNSYGMAASKAGDISDLLFAIVKRGKTTFAELAGSIGMVATTAASGGISLEEMGAAIATMTRSGVKTENAITALQAIISSFLKPTSEAADFAKKLGFEMSVATLKAEGLQGIFRKIGDLPPDAISKLFPNVRALRGVLPALQNMEGFVSDIAGMSDRAGETDKAYAKMTDTISHAFKQLKQGAVVLLNEVGELFGTTFEDLSDIFQGWIADARGWLDEYGTDFKWYIEDAWTEAKRIFKESWAWIKDNVLSLVGDDFDTAFETVREAATTLWDTLKAIWATGTSALSQAVDIAKMFFEDPAHAGRLVADAFNEVWEIAADAVDFTRGSSLLDKLVDFFGGLAEKLRESGFIDKITDLIAGVFALNTKLWAAALVWATELGIAVAKAIADALAGFFQGGPLAMLLRAKVGDFRGGAASAQAPSAAAPSGGPVTGPVDQPELHRPGHRPGDIVTSSKSMQPSGGVTQNVTINARNPLDPKVTEGIKLNLKRLDNRGR